LIRRWIAPLLTCGVMAFVCAAAGADSSTEVIYIPIGQQAPEKKDLPRPTRGMSKTAVLDQFGLPVSKTAPVGDPPISSWRYPDYTVYFESDTVIHSVLTHVPKVKVEDESPR